MKKRMLILLAVILVLVACADTEEEPKDVSEKENKSEEKENKVDEEANENDEEADSNDEENGEQQETKIEKTDPDDEQTEEDATTDDKSDAESEATDDEKSDEESDEKPSEESSEAGDAANDILGFGFELFDAQVDEDYDYLESVLSKGSSLDRENHTIQFDNVTSPHEYEFISKADRDNLDERYIQEEDDGSVIIGFEVIDYMNESSYIIDVQFIQEDDEWKVNDMDINK